MATTGSLDVNLTALSNLTNNSTEVASAVTKEVRDQGDLIGLGIAVAIALVLIFGAVFVAIGFVPKLMSAVKNYKKA